MTEKTTITLPGGIQVGLQGTTLVVLMGIGYFARGAMQEQLENIEKLGDAVVELQRGAVEVSKELKALKTQVETNQQLRTEFENYRRVMDEKLDAIMACAKNRRACP